MKSLMIARLARPVLSDLKLFVFYKNLRFLIFFDKQSRMYALRVFPAETMLTVYLRLQVARRTNSYKFLPDSYSRDTFRFEE